MTHQLDLERLAKVMEMFRSPYDGERLAALERANGILERAGVSWSELCRGSARPKPTKDRKASARAAAQKAASQRPEQDFLRCSLLARQIVKHPGFVNAPKTAKRIIIRLMLSTTTQISAEEAKVVELLAKLLGIVQGAEK